MPVTAEQRRELRQVGLLDQEVRLGPSTFALAGRAADQRREARLEAAIAERFHLGDRAADRGHECGVREQRFGSVRGDAIHGGKLAGSSVGAVGFSSGETVRNLKILILAFGGLGIVSLLLNMEALKHGFDKDLVNTILILGGFALPILMGLMGIMKPPMEAWQAAVALAGFVLVGVKIEIWKTLPKIMDAPTGGKLTMIAVVGGAVVSLLAAIKPESKS